MGGIFKLQQPVASGSHVKLELYVLHASYIIMNDKTCSRTRHSPLLAHPCTIVNDVLGQKYKGPVRGGHVDDG